MAGGPRGASGAAEGRREEVDGGAQEHSGDVQGDAGPSNQGVAFKQTQVCDLQ